MSQIADETPRSRALYLSSWYKGKVLPADINDFEDTAKLHVDKILAANAESVFDIGCGAGGILLALQKANINELYGVDASSEAIALAKKRFSKFGELNGVSLEVADILNVNPPVTDAVSLHRVVCCFPDLKGMLNKAIENNPKVLIITFPRDKWYVKLLTLLENLFLGLASWIKPSLKGLRGYVHTTHLIDSHLKNNGLKTNLASNISIGKQRYM